MIKQSNLQSITEPKSSGLLKKTLKTLQSRTSSQTLPNELKNLYSYDNILLRTYIDIAQKGDFKLLIISGEADTTELLEAWEAIVKADAKANGSFTYDAYLNLIKAYGTLVAEYTSVRALLTKLRIVTDYSDVKYVRKKGYKIDLTDSDTFTKSLDAATKRTEGLVTRIKMKQNEIAALYKEAGHGSGNRMGFEQVIANLIFHLGFQVDDNITLARYNAYKQIIKQKQEAERKARKKQ